MLEDLRAMATIVRSRGHAMRTRAKRRTWANKGFQQERVCIAVTGTVTVAGARQKRVSKDVFRVTQIRRTGMYVSPSEVTRAGIRWMPRTPRPPRALRREVLHERLHGEADEDHST